MVTVCNFIEECGEEFWPEDEKVLDMEFEALANKQDWEHISNVRNFLDIDEVDLEISNQEVATKFGIYNRNKGV